VAQSSGYLACAIIKHVAIAFSFQALMSKMIKNIDSGRVLKGLKNE
jgi:hypothetical protein